MPAKSPKLLIHLDLLKPQSSPEKLPVKLLKWLLSTGRYILIFVEALVLLAFLMRFKLDADLAERKEAIEEQIPYLESLAPYEKLIRQTQLKLSTINTHYANIADYQQILTKIANQTPQGVRIISINLDRSVGKISIQINATAQTNFDLAIFLTGLKSDPQFLDIALISVGLEQGIIRFSLTSQAQTQQGISL